MIRKAAFIRIFLTELLETEEIVEDESLNEVIDSSAEGELNSIYQDLTGEVTEEKLQETIKNVFWLKSGLFRDLGTLNLLFRVVHLSKQTDSVTDLVNNY